MEPPNETLDDANCSAVEAVHAPQVRDQGCGRYSDPEWHVVATEWNSETLAAETIRNLDGGQFQVFLPRIRKRVPQTLKRPARIEESFAFPGYLLVLWDSSWRWQRLKSAEGVSSILHEVGNREHPAIVNPRFMWWLLTSTKRGVIEQFSDPNRLPAIPTGASVMIEAEHFRGQVAACEWSSEERIALLMGALRLNMRRDQVREL